MAQLSSSKAKALALAMTVAAVAATFPISARAQQVAIPAQCASIVDIAKQAQCTMQHRYNSANAQIRANQAAERCLDQLAAAKANNPADFQAAKAAAGVTRIEAGQECLVASRLPQRRADTAPVPTLAPTPAALRQ